MHGRDRRKFTRRQSALAIVTASQDELLEHWNALGSATSHALTYGAHVVVTIRIPAGVAPAADEPLSEKPRRLVARPTVDDVEGPLSASRPEPVESPNRGTHRIRPTA